jgi:4-phospho-D-threonate 3-dehydrogenase / 4-phospho-D-erythronate 3-dehydrogenase
MRKRPILVLSMGDVNGVGPEILAKALARPELMAWCVPVVVGSLEVLENARSYAKALPTLVAIEHPKELPVAAGQVAVLDGGFKAPQLQPGTLDPEAGLCAAEWIKTGTQLCLDGAVGGIVTCPISKECIQKAGYAYSGHTTLIAEMCRAQDYRMCLFTDTMRIVHITAHCSLLEAVQAVKTDRIVRSLQIGYQALRRMGMAAPRIAVAGLNPHAGEAGAFGREEIEEIAPAVAWGQAQGMDCTGPYPPDTVFKRMSEGEFDMVIAMYHDQGHIPLKLIAMDEGVNVTLGIPIVRTSVDHGTAYDIAGKGVAREDSLCAAVQLAARLCGTNPEAGQ